MPTAQARAVPKAWWWRLSARSLLARPVQAKAKPALRTMAREQEAGGEGGLDDGEGSEEEGGHLDGPAHHAHDGGCQPAGAADQAAEQGGAQAVLGRLLARVEGLQRDRQVVEDGGCASQQQAERQLGHRAAMIGA